jgi:hypothetical protein
MSISAPLSLPSYTTTYGSVAVTAASVGGNVFTILPANPNRAGGGLVVNNTDKTIFISVGATAPTLNNGFGIPPGGNYDLSPGQKEVVRGIAASPNGTVNFAEYVI